MRKKALNQHSNFISLNLNFGCCVFISWYDFLQRFLKFGMKKV